MIALSILLKVSLVVLAAVVLERALARRASAAARHMIWTLAIVASLLLPVFTVALPEWTAVTWTAPAKQIARASLPPSRLEAAASLTGVDSGGNAPPAPAAPRRVSARAVSGTMALLGVYALGVALLFGRMVAERATLRRLIRNASSIADPAWTTLRDECAAAIRLRRGVALLRSAERVMPMVCGLWRSSVLLPPDAEDWPEDRRRAVLLHELAHVARFDCLTQTLAALASALYWPNPGVWWMARRLRVERELACDDCVLASGADARAYAGHLLEIAYSLGTGRVPVLAATMAGSRQLEGRMLAVLDAARDRTPPALRGRLGAVGLMLALVVPIAVATARALPDPSSAPAASSTADHAHVDPIEETGPGTWELRPVRDVGGVYLTLSHVNGRHGGTVAVSELAGLTPEALAAGGAVRFRRRHDAGTFEFEGVARGGVGAGTYTFAPDPSFPEQLLQRGLARPTPAQQQVLARQDIGLAFLDQVANAGAPPTLEQLMNAAQQGVDPDFIEGLRKAGYESLSLDELVRLRNHGVDPEYIEELRALGHRGLTLQQLIDLRNHGVDPDYIRELAELGHKGLSLEELTTLRSHGVDPDYIRELAELGHKGLSLEELTTLRSHGVDPDYIRELAELGHKGLSLEELTTLRSHGVDPDYIRELAELGYKGLTLEELTNLRGRGVDPDYTREMSALTGQKLSLDQLIDFRSRGIDPAQIREMRELTRPPR